MRKLSPSMRWHIEGISLPVADMVVQASLALAADLISLVIA